MPDSTGRKSRRKASAPSKKGRDSFFLLSSTSKRTAKSVAKPAPKRGSAKRTTSGNVPYVMPDWMHWVVTALIIVLIGIGAWYLFLRPYMYRLRPCQGAKEYGVCLPSGFTYYGIDVSHHQGVIDWQRVAEASQVKGFPIKFAFIKATEGSTFTDPDYQNNISNARRAGIVCGAYHFYDPWTSPEKQAQHFINTVQPERGDMVPVVDVERGGRSSANLRQDLSIFMTLIEEHFGVKPILYTSVKFRQRNLNSHNFDDYPFWVAHYYVVRPNTDKNWCFWQFTDRAGVEGIAGYTDFNVFKGTPAQFESLRFH